MKPFRCQICGETYLGSDRPDRCPYCGSPGHNLKNPGEWIDYGIIAMTNQSKEFCLQAMEFEVSNREFYKMCALKAQTQINVAVFERLHDQEDEHAELISKMLGISEPSANPEDAPEKDSDKFTQAHERELRAVLHYQQIARYAPETRVKEVFAALTDVEGEHLKIANNYR